MLIINYCTPLGESWSTLWLGVGAGARGWGPREIRNINTAPSPHIPHILTQTLHQCPRDTYFPVAATGLEALSSAHEELLEGPDLLFERKFL